MTDNNQAASRGMFDAIVCHNKQIRRCYYRLGLEFSEAAAKIFANFSPGQFVQLDLCATSLPKDELIPENLADTSKRSLILRRPFSICDVTVHKGTTVAEILYCVVGPASLRMTSLRIGDTISLIGPLGRGFWVPQGKKTALLAAGGMGLPPLLHLAKFLTSEHPEMNAVAIVGAKSKQELPFEKQIDEISEEIGYPIADFSKYGVESKIATDDGSLGFHGLVTDCLTEWLNSKQKNPEEKIIYACGPEAMLAKAAKIAKEKHIDCQVSMERRMACGIGICQSCAIECTVPESNETVYKLCCEDGPVFDAKEVVF